MSSKTVNTRELLRNFKDIKAQLTSGRVHYVVIDIGNNRELELTMRGPRNTGENILRHLLSQPKPHGRIRRTRIFDTLFSRKR